MRMLPSSQSQKSIGKHFTLQQNELSMEKKTRYSKCAQTHTSVRAKSRETCSFQETPGLETKGQNHERGRPRY